MKAVLFGGGRCVRWRFGGRGWSWLRFRRFEIRLLRVLGGLFVGGADGFAPGIGVVGVDVFVLGEGQDLDEGLAEIGEGGGGFWVYLALGDRGEKAFQGGAETAGGHKTARQVTGNI